MQSLKKEAAFAASKKISCPISPLSGCSINNKAKKSQIVRVLNGLFTVNRNAGVAS